MTNLRVITAPTTEPISLETARLQVRKDDIGTGIEDDLIRGWITSARESAEQFLGMLLTDAEYEYRIDELSSCGVIWLPAAPVGIVSGITYVDDLGAVQTLSPALYVFDNNLRAPAIRLAYQATWPATRSVANAVVITFQGYYSASVSPPLIPPRPILSAMQLMIHDLYRNRGETVLGRWVAMIPVGAQSLMQPYRLRMGV